MGLDEGDELVHALFGEEMVRALRGPGGGLERRMRGSLRLRPARRRARGGDRRRGPFADYQNGNEPPWGAASRPRHRSTASVAGARAFSRWLAGFCSALPGRRAGSPSSDHTASAPPRRETSTGCERSVLASAMLPTVTTSCPRTTIAATTVVGGVFDAGLPVTFPLRGYPREGYGPHAMSVTKVEPCSRSTAARRLIFGGVFGEFPSSTWPSPTGGRSILRCSAARQAVRDRPSSGVADHLELADQSAVQLLRGGLVLAGPSTPSTTNRVRPDHVGRGLPPHRGTWPRLRVHAPTPSTDATPTRSTGCPARRRPACMASYQSPRTRGPTGVPMLDDLLSPASPPPATYDAVDYALGKVSGKESGRRLMQTMLPG